jgi:serine/threonine protein phosphatase PrpC
VLTAAFARAHAAITAAFSDACVAAGWTVTAQPEGFLVRTRGGGAQTFCVHGGTTATVALVLGGGARLVIANVGDSAALLCGAGGAALALRPADEWTPLSPRSDADAGGVGAGGATLISTSTSATAPAPATAVPCVEVTTDHTPESAAEFERMAAFRPRAGAAPGARPVPELLFVYDSLTASKLTCPPIFEPGPDGGPPRKTGRGTYYKNVRSEWASLVATPPAAMFQDALAFTRSLGDLHLQAYGVTHVPAVRWAALGGGARARALALVVASDGLWDNWKADDVAAVVLADEVVAGLTKNGRAAAKAAADALMRANLARAAANFGDSADNMTLAVTWLLPA